MSLHRRRAIAMRAESRTWGRRIRGQTVFLLSLGLALLCSCATAHEIEGPMDATSSMDAARPIDAGLDSPDAHDVSATGIDAWLDRDASSDAGAGAPRDASNALDAGAGEPWDAGADAPSDGASSIDVGRVCPPVEEHRPACGTCDVTAWVECYAWADWEACGGHTCSSVHWAGNASCDLGSGCCVKSNGGSIAGAFCGEGPPCGPNEVCAYRFPGEEPACRCITDAP